MTLTRVVKTVDVDITMTPKDLATAFWLLDAHEQAEFFNDLAKASRSFFSIQLAHVSASRDLTSEGRSVMRIIGEYGEIDELEQP